MSRGVGSGVSTAVDARHVKWFPLLELALDSGTQYLAGHNAPVDYGGHTYLAALGLGTIDTIEETDAEVKGLVFTMTAVPSSSVSLSLGTEVQGRGVLLRLAFIDAAGALQVDDNVWSGYLDQAPMEDDPETNRTVIRVTAEHRLVRWDTPRPLRFSDEDQRVISSSDGFFKHTAAIAEATLNWPYKEFFQQ